MDEVLTATLCHAVHDRLDYLDTLATKGDLRCASHWPTPRSSG